MKLQAMSNPMMWMMGEQNPGMMKGMMQNMIKLMPQGGMQGMAGTPSSAPMGGILGALGGLFTQHNAAQSPNALNNPIPSNAPVGQSVAQPAAQPAAPNVPTSAIPSSNAFQTAPETQLTDAQLVQLSPYINQGFTNIKPMGNGLYGGMKNGQHVTIHLPGA